MTLKRNWVHFVSESSGFDLISSLWQMNLLHVISQIFNSLDTSSLQSCNQISEEWCEILSHVKLQREKHVRRISLESNISSICLRDNSIVLGSTNGMVSLSVIFSLEENLKVRPITGGGFRSNKDGATI